MLSTKCPDCPAEAPYSGKGPLLVRCDGCRRAHNAAKQRARRADSPRAVSVPRERPPCIDCGGALPPKVGRGGTSERCWPCTRAYRTGAETAKRRGSRLSAVCYICGAAMPGKQRNARCCEACLPEHRRARETARRAAAGLPPRARKKPHTDYINSDGYRVVSKPGGGQVLEHRQLMAEHLGRELLPAENVHHINGVRDDNRLSNIELWTKSQPAGQRVSDKVAWAKELLALYEPEALR